MNSLQRKSGSSGAFGGAPGFSILLRRNCSMTPAGLMAVFGALALVSLGIGVGFLWVGAWLVLPFAGIEVLLLGAAFLVHARHAADYEWIARAGRRLEVGRAMGERLECVELDMRLARVRLERSSPVGARVLLCGDGKPVEVGSHLDVESRVALASERTRRMSEWSGRGQS